MEENSQIRQVVIEAISESLSVDPAEVRGDARFFHDLNGESIDLLDVQFRVDKSLKLRINIQRLLGEGLAVREDGTLEPASVTALQERLPYLDYSRLPSAPTADHVQELITVDAIVRIVEATAAQGSASATLA